jgi:DNA polymerase-3 subunit delta'
MLSSKAIDPYYNIEVPKSNSILINSIRSLKKELTLSKIEKGWNIILILEAEKLCYPNNVAANALLKILEEPPEKTLFILITSNHSKIIDTIKSRCQSIFFPKIHHEKLYDLMNKDLSNEDKNIIISIADGNINIIKSLNNSIADIYNDLKIFIKSCYSNQHEYNDKIIQRVSLLKRTNKVQLLIFFRIIMIYFKDLFVFSESNDIKYIVYKNLDNHYSKITSYYNQSEWNKCIDVVENTLNNIYRNASIPLCINGMLIEIQQTISGKKVELFDINDWLEAK